MKTSRRIVYTLFALKLALAVSMPAAAGIPSFSEDFVYQGRLEQSGVPADGTYDFQFELFRDASGSNSVGGLVFVDDVQVSEGVFTAEVPLGFAIDGMDLWLQVAVKQPDDQLYTILMPRHQLRAVPNAVFAAALDHSITDDEVNSSLVQLRVFGNCPSGEAIRAIDSGGGVTCQSAAGAGWSVTGNAGTSPGANFLGTTDDTPLELRANDERMVRYEWIDGSPGSSAPSITAGSGANAITGSVAATIAGGGLVPAPNIIDGADGAIIAGGFGNSVTGARGAIGGGTSNSVGGQRAVVPGGSSNIADGDNSFAAGVAAQALHDNTFVWNNGGGVFASTGPDEFLISADRTGIGTNSPSDFLHLNVPPSTNALRVQIDGSTKLRVRDNGGVVIGVNAVPPADGLEVQGDAVFRGDVRFNNPVTRWATIPAAGFIPTESAMSYRSDGGYLYRTSSTASANEEFAARLTLPHGAVITELRFRAHDAEVTGDIRVRLRRRGPGGSDLLASAQTSGVSGSATTYVQNSISNAVVNNQSYGYMVEIDLDEFSGDPLFFYYARVTYTTDSLGP